MIFESALIQMNIDLHSEKFRPARASNQRPLDYYTMNTFWANRPGVEKRKNYADIFIYFKSVLSPISTIHNIYKHIGRVLIRSTFKIHSYLCTS